MVLEIGESESEVSPEDLLVLKMAEESLSKVIPTESEWASFYKKAMPSINH